jgi:hypothetical protein
MKNCVHQSHVALQLEFLKNLYTTIVQLSFWYYKYYATIPLEIWGVNK